MKLVYRAIQFMILLLAAGLLLSCTTIHTLPEKFATLEQAFPAGEWAGLPKDLPAGSFKAAVFEAPYEDVFRAVNVSATQNMFNVEFSDKSKGLIRAARSVTGPNPFQAPALPPTVQSEKRYFYVILVREKGPKSTEVSIVSKVQISCSWPQVGLFQFPKTCQEHAVLQYATDRWYTSMQEMNNLMSLIRNNLIAAGLL